MEKPQILGVKSEEYSKGRLDSFSISEKNRGFEAIVSCLVDFGFSEESIKTEIDLALEHRDYLFLYLNHDLKVHLSAEGTKNSFVVRFDTSLSREKINKVMGKYFQFPK